MYDFDLLVIGAGSGGLACAKRAASYGKKVAIIEGDKVGGTCVIRGCVPKKIMSYAGQIAETYNDAIGYGFKPASNAINFSEFVSKRDTEIGRLNALHIKLLKNAKVALIEGWGSFINDHTIKVGNKSYTSEIIVIATGGKAVKPNIQGIEHTITSDELWDIKELPKTLTVVGGGYIGLEFASIFNALGSTVHVCIRRDLPLANFDHDISVALKQQMEQRGITFHTDHGIEKISLGKSNRKNLHLASDEIIESDAILFATGRLANTEHLNLAGVDISTEKDFSIPADQQLLTNVRNIYAIGDVINRVNLTPVAIKHGRMISDNLYNNSDLTVEDESPTAVFTSPQVGSSGLTEQQAEKLYGIDNIEVYESKFRPMYCVLAERNEQSLMKMVINKQTDHVLGLHMVGRDAAEIIQGFAVAVKMGATKKQFDNTIAIHPSSAEEFVLMR